MDRLSDMILLPFMVSSRLTYFMMCDNLYVQKISVKFGLEDRVSRLNTNSRMHALHRAKKRCFRRFLLTLYEIRDNLTSINK